MQAYHRPSIGAGPQARVFDPGTLDILAGAVRPHGRRRVVCRRPVFSKGASATENSLITAGRALSWRTTTATGTRSGLAGIALGRGGLYLGVLDGVVALRDG
jgi:hypothetical protein